MVWVNLLLILEFGQSLTYHVGTVEKLMCDDEKFNIFKLRKSGDKEIDGR
jgi:hypothetical protein